MLAHSINSDQKLKSLTEENFQNKLALRYPSTCILWYLINETPGVNQAKTGFPQNSP